MSAADDPLRERRAAVEELLARHVPAADGPAADLLRAAADALGGAGKRLRPILVLAVADLLGKPRERVGFLAAAVECIHSASLVLDDLPAMDDARLRRGRPALHVRHGESTAILAAIGLLMRAMEVLAEGARAARLKAPDATALMAQAAATVGLDGMAAGQWADLHRMAPGAGLDVVEFVHRRKTGKLFELSIDGAARICGASGAEREALAAYGRNLGLAFQVKDDLLDRTGSMAELGKDTAKDRGKTTFVDLAGQAAAERLLGELVETAAGSLVGFGRRAEMLVELARFVRDRRN